MTTRSWTRNLAKLTCISALAMGALVDYRRGVGRRGVVVRLANVQGPVWLALESAGLLQSGRLQRKELSNARNQRGR
jgi:hypothetical protein